MKGNDGYILNLDQIQAIRTTEGYVRLIGSAGSGKTDVLAHRFSYLVNELNVSASNILCVTFTKKAVNDMKKSIRTLTEADNTVYVSTFHGLCVKILREDIDKIDYPRDFIVIDAEDMDTVIESIYEDFNISTLNISFENAKKYIYQRKMDAKYLEEMLRFDRSELKARCINAKSLEEAIFYGYLYEQKKSYGLDLVDLINFVQYIFEKYQNICLKWQKKFEYIMIDEFQDISKGQYELANILSKYHKNLLVAGDPDQAIYSWRGGEIKYILDFDKSFKDVRTIIMNRNYRSTPNIIDVSNSLINHNENRIKKELRAMKKRSIPVVYNHEKTAELEAKWIIKQIKVLLQSGRSLNEIAILYRNHFVSRPLEEALIKEKIQYVLYSGLEFYKRREIKDILSYLRMIVNADNISFSRVVNIPNSNIGLKEMDFLKNYAESNNCSLYMALKENTESDLISQTRAKGFISVIDEYRDIYKDMSISDVFTGILVDSGYEKMLKSRGYHGRLDNLAELKQSIIEYENSADMECSLEDYLDKIALFTNVDQEEKSDALKLMAVHTAKGQEFPYVFVCGLNEGVFPSNYVTTIESLEEERRLAYVACTRAENALFLSSSDGFNYDGSFRYPSRFILNIDKLLLHYTNELEKQLIDDTESFVIQSEKKLNDSEEIVEFI